MQQQQQIWSRQLYEQATRQGQFLDLLGSRKAKPLTRVQRIKRRIQNIRLSVGGWIAGVNLKD